MVADSSDDAGDPDMDKNIYCLCGTTYDPNIFMIQCDICRDWFHGSCCNFHEYTAIEVERFHCPRCAVSCGPSVYKPYLNGHRHDYWDENAGLKAVQTGTPVFVRELCARHFTSDNEIVSRMTGHQLTDTLLLQQGFNNPIIVDNLDGLGMTIPPPNFSLYDVEAFIGGGTDIDVIDVTRQTDLKMKLRDYVGYYNSLNRHRIFNVISLEFSNTALGKLVEAPAVARKLDWANTMWPKDYHILPPQVQKYCLMSVKNSFTDFHVDFGGTSVWYHVLRGQKVFYFVKPNSANLTLYQQWMTSSNQSEMFFGDQADSCYKCILNQGQTMLIPTGWIHAVYTPTDSLVFGGNFLHSLNISMQLQIYDLEKKIKTIEKFRYPNFECINWFAAQNMYLALKELNSEEVRVPDTLLNSLKDITLSLKRWINNKYHCYYGKAQVPEGLNYTKLFKDIGKEIRHAERYIHTIEPPKPERESKRTRKRPFNKDFVDYSLSPKFLHDYSSQLKSEQPQRLPPLKLTLPKPCMYPYKTSPAKKKPVELITEDVNWQRPEETTAIHRGGAVLQFRLGTKDYFARTQSNEVSSTSTTSVYDFHDDSEREEQTTINAARKSKKLAKKRLSLKEKSPVAKWCIKDNTIETEGEIKIERQYNGTESPRTLIKTGFVDSEVEVDESLHSADTMGLTLLSNARPVSSISLAGEMQRLEDENISKVHQDDDYIYPSLDNSDDEDVQIFKPRGRSRIDEPWSPKVRVGPLLPKMNRPTREGTKKQAVEKVLEAAAAKRASEAVTEKNSKRQYRKRKPKPKVEKKESQPSTSTSVGTSTSTSSVQKQRKGMKTVKQRLGKILKIHKMKH